MAFPGSYLGVSLEVALGADLTADPSTWAWTDATAYVRAASGIRVTRGGFDGSIQSPPSQCSFTADNSDGRWVPTNPTGAWYGQIANNTPVRVVVDEGTPSVRWTGFLAELPARWNSKETDRYVPVVAAGILRRLERGSTPLRSPLVRAISGGKVDGAGNRRLPVAYWPGEDGAGSTSIAEYFGGKPMEITGQVVTLASDGPDGSLPVPEFTTVGGVIGLVPSRPSTGKWEVACLFNFPAVPSAATVLLRWYTSGTYPLWQITLTPGSPDTLQLEAYDTTGTIQINDPMDFDIPSGPGSEPYNNWLMLFANAEQNGANVDYDLELYAATAGVGISGTENSITAGQVTSIRVHANSKIDGMHAGHWAVWDTTFGVFPVDPAAISAFNGDTVSDRIGRINSELSAPIDGTSQEHGTDDVNAMGPQVRGTRLDTIRECEVVTNGRLIENRDPTSADAVLGLLAHDYLSNQTAALTLDHDSGNLSDLQPTDDDQQLRNDWTVTRTGASGSGSSARAVDDHAHHAHSTVSVGTYDDSVSVNVETDEQLVHQAGWRLNIGTVDGPRFPTVVVDFARNPSLIPTWIACDIGSRVTITNPPEGIAPDTIELLIEGWTEVFGPKTWQVALNCSPYALWHVFQLAETSGDTDPFLGRLDGDHDCALRVAIDTDDTSIVFDPNFYRWTVDSDDFPLDIELKPLGASGVGEVVTLSSIATTAAVFISAGTATHGSNASVTPGFPASTTTGDNLFVLAAIRNSGTGTVNTPTGYTRLAAFGATTNVGLFTKVDGGSESAPEVSFTGGVANATTSAVMFAFRGLPVSLVDMADMVVDYIEQLNASAANIAYGGLYARRFFGSVTLVIGWKQDDYTSVAVPSGFTEMFEASSGTGDDQSLYCAYRIDTTPVVTVNGSLAVTGGASAISRSAVVALAGGYQTMTASARNANGITGGMSHAVGALVAVHDPAVLAL